MKSILSKAKSHSKNIVVHLKRHHKKYLFGAFWWFAIVKMLLLFLWSSSLLNVWNTFADGPENLIILTEDNIDNYCQITNIGEDEWCDIICNKKPDQKIDWVEYWAFSACNGNINTLDLSNQNISSLEFYYKYENEWETINIQNLILSNNKITTIKWTFDISHELVWKLTPNSVTTLFLQEKPKVKKVWDKINIKPNWNIDLSNNLITSIETGAFSGLSLNTLDLSYNLFSTLDFYVFEWITSLITLNIGNNQLYDLELKEIPELQNLQIRNNCLTEQEINQLDETAHPYNIDWKWDQKACFHIEYQPETLTNQDVIVTLTLTWQWNFFEWYSGTKSFSEDKDDYFDVNEFYDKSWDIINYPENWKFFATVNWIDKEAPTTTIIGVPEDWTWSDITVRFTTSTNWHNSTNTTYYCSYESGDTCEPIFSWTTATVSCSDWYACYKYLKYYSVDWLGNTEEINTSAVIKIDKSNPHCDNVTFDTDDPTNGNVTAYLHTSDTWAWISQDTPTSVLFTGNDTKDIQILDNVWNNSFCHVNVYWIDRDAPNCDVTYDEIRITTGNVTASLSCDETVICADLSYTFTWNWTHLFEYQDLAGNTGSANAYVNWINVTWIVLNNENIGSICGIFDNNDNYYNWSWKRIDCSGKNIIDIEQNAFSAFNEGITIIDLSNNLLSKIESWVFYWLDDLNSIKLWSNKISSIETNSFSGLSKLDTLWLNDNLLSWFNPNIITWSDNLRQLQLGNNQLSNINSGTFRWLTGLRTIHLGWNQITTVDPKTFDWLYDLGVLSLSNNKISTIDSWLFNWLNKLEDLNLSHNNIEKLENWTFSWLNKLTHLYLDYNEIESINSGLFYWLTGLKNLFLDNNRINNVELWSFRWLDSLQILYLNNNQIINIDKHMFDWLSKLYYLTVYENCLTQNIKRTFTWINNILNSNQKLCFSPIYQNYWDFVAAKLELTGDSTLYDRYYDTFDLDKSITFTGNWISYFDISEWSWNSLFIKNWSWFIYYPKDWKVKVIVDDNTWHNSPNQDIEFSIRIDDTIRVWEYTDFTVKVIRDGSIFKNYNGTIYFSLTDKNGDEIDDDLYKLPRHSEYDFNADDKWKKTFENGLKIEKAGTYILQVEWENWWFWEEVIVVTWYNKDVVYDEYKFNPNFSDEENEAYQYSYYYWITTKNSIKEANMYSWLTRIAMAKMLSQYAINALWIDNFDEDRNCTFKDVSTSLDRQYDNWVTKACQLWIMWVNMPDNKFYPNWYVSRGEFATALSRLLFETPDWTDKYYSTHINKLGKEWILTNTDPNLREKRWFVMLMLKRAWEDYDY